MAYRGGAVAPAGGTESSITVTVSGIGIQSGDIVVLFGVFGGGGTLTPTFPTGFSAIPGLSTVNCNNQTMAAAYKVAGSSEPSSYTVTPGSNDYLSLLCAVWSGRNTSSPFTAVATTVGTNTSSLPQTLSVTGLTAALSDDIGMFVGMAGTGNGQSYSFTPPSGYSNGQISTAAVYYNPAAASATNLSVSAGATGTLGGSINASGGANTTYGGYVLSLAAGGGGPTVHPYMMMGMGM